MSDIVRPIDPFELTQEFGVNPALYKRFGLAGHNGWDFRTKFPDTPEGHRTIAAPWFMEFYRQGNEGNDGFGLYFETICRLQNTWKLTYAHCKSIETFTTKQEGETLAISDSTGNSTGSHLHLTVKRIKIINGQHQVQNAGNGFFGAVNPQEFFDELRSFKSQGGKSNNTEAITMTIDGELFALLVDGATVRKELANSIKNDGGVGFDDPDHTPLQNFKDYIAGLKVDLQNSEKRLMTLSKPKKQSRAKSKTKPR